MEILRTIRNTEIAARKILDEANIRAEKIRRETENKAEEVYKKVYEETIAESRRRVVELKRKVKDDAEREAESFLHDAEEQTKKIRAKAESRFDEAVRLILDEILS
jgi:vacuolar-type H+-ATPase subunit H